MSDNEKAQNSRFSYSESVFQADLVFAALLAETELKFDRVRERWPSDIPLGRMSDDSKA